METLSIKGFEGVIEVIEIVLDKKNVLNTFYCKETIICSNHAFSRDLIIDSKDFDSLKSGEVTVLSAMPDWYKVNVGAKQKSFADQKGCSLLTAFKNMFK